MPLPGEAAPGLTVCFCGAGCLAVLDYPAVLAHLRGFRLTQGFEASIFRGYLFAHLALPESLNHRFAYPAGGYFPTAPESNQRALGETRPKAPVAGGGTQGAAKYLARCSGNLREGRIHDRQPWYVG